MPGPAVPGSHTTNYYDGQSIREYQDSILCEWVNGCAMVGIWSAGEQMGKDGAE